MNFVARCLVLWIAFLSSACCIHAQETCSEEVKLLLAPAQVQAAVIALKARGETRANIYFFDTPNLDLLAKGVILRMREGSEIDLTAKLRPLAGERFTDPSNGRERYKCEVDLNAGIENQSYSLQSNNLAGKVPESGEELFARLSDGQKKLLEDSGVQVDWKSVKRVANIQSTSWSTKARAPLGKLSMELWQWSAGSVLEVSTKVATDAGQSTYAEMKDLAAKKGLTLSPDQRSKTAIALESINSGSRR